MRKEDRDWTFADPTTAIWLIQLRDLIRGAKDELCSGAWRNMATEQEVWLADRLERWHEELLTVDVE